MAIMSAAEYQEKHARNLKNASQDIVNGIRRLTVSPTEEAAKKQTKMLQNLTAAVQSGEWAKGLRRVTLADWQNAAADVGVPRIAAGIDAAKQDVIDFATQFLPFVDNVAKQVNAMPDLNLNDSIQRMVKQVSEVAKFKRA